MADFKRIEQALEDLKLGKLIIVADDEDRENEGDLIAAAERVTTASMNFMASVGKGLICMPMSATIAHQLNFRPMVTENTDNHGTAFTESIDHVNTLTGVSAEERALTARMVASREASASDFRRPGHMFPLIAKKNGVLERNGHTEATVDLMRLAGLKEVGLCVEIMTDDGLMMRTPDLKKLAEKHQLTFITIAEIQAYRKVHDQLVEKVSQAQMPTKYGDFTAHTFINRLNGDHHVALVKGDITSGEPILTRAHSECLTGDAFGSMRCDCGEQLANAMKQINDKGQGILLYLRQEGRGIGIVNKLKAYELQDQGLDTVEANHALGLPADAREYYIAAQMLKDLGVQKIDLLTNNPDKVSQLENYGINIHDRIAIQIPANEVDYAYLKTKQDKMGHLVHY